MKEREFDIENYKELLVKKAYTLIAKKMTTQIGGVIFAPTKLGRYGVDCSSGIVDIFETEEILNLFDKDESNQIVSELKSEFNAKRIITIAQFEKSKKIVDTILFDDRDYQALVIALEDLYYCQAETMLCDVLESKLKGKTAKAMKYQARRMALLNTVTCD